MARPDGVRGGGTRWLALLALLAPGMLHASESWLLTDALGLPDWLHVVGESRMRFETLDGQFRAGGTGGDQVLALRTLVLAELERGPVQFGLEIQDSRVYRDDAGTQLSPGIVNPVDVLQAYIRYRLPSPLAPAAATEVSLGRMTLSIGSGRQVDRFEFANVVPAYTGLHARSLTAHGHEFQAFHTVLVERRPIDRADLADNRAEADREQWGRRFWGLHYRHAELLGSALPRLWTEAYVYGLRERDRDGVETANRDYVTPGLRIYRVPHPGAWDMELEAAWRFGTRRATVASDDRLDLDVRGRMVHAALGYTFDHPLRPRIAIDYDYASGDDDPDDNRFGQYEFLFGARRADFGHTSLYGPLAPANISAPGARFEFRRDTRLDGRITWKAAYLASSRDAWVAARVVDPAGKSGRFIGHSIDARIRHWLIPGTLRAEVGASTLLAGRFAREAPNATRAGDTRYGYLQMTVYF
jgi:hypothetical protein